jgi:SM-20-related protein
MAEQIGVRSFQPGPERMLSLDRIDGPKMETEPYEWAFVERRFSTENAAALASSFPSDMRKKVKRYDDEEGCEYMSRSLIHMGALIPSSPEGLSPAWRSVAEELLSAEYRS